MDCGGRGSTLTTTRRGKKYECGFSLLEGIVAVAISAIVFAGAVPALGQVLGAATLTSVTNSFLATLYLARSEAILRNRRVTICPSDGAYNCLGETGYQFGWIVFEDLDEDGDHDSDEIILAATAYDRPGLRMEGSGTVRGYVSYVPTGETRTVSNALQMGTIKTCCNGVGRTIVIAATGRARIELNTICGSA